MLSYLLHCDTTITPLPWYAFRALKTVSAQRTYHSWLTNNIGFMWRYMLNNMSTLFLSVITFIELYSDKPCQLPRGLVCLLLHVYLGWEYLCDRQQEVKGQVDRSASGTEFLNLTKTTFISSLRDVFLRHGEMKPFFFLHTSLFKQSACVRSIATSQSHHVSQFNGMGQISKEDLVNWQIRIWGKLGILWSEWRQLKRYAPSLRPQFQGQMCASLPRHIQC